MPDTATMLTMHVVSLSSYIRLLKFDFIHLISIYKTIIWHGCRTVEAIEAGLREKVTDKLNSNPTKILERNSLLVTNPWLTKTTTLCHYKFHMKFNIPTSLYHIALKNLSLLSLLATRYLMRCKNNCLCTRSIVSMALCMCLCEMHGYSTKYIMQSIH